MSELTPDQVTEINRWVNLLGDLFRDENYIEIDRIINTVDIPKMNTSALIAIVRRTFSGRERLHNWITLRDRVCVELITRELDPKKLLHGIC